MWTHFVAAHDTTARSACSSQIILFFKICHTQLDWNRQYILYLQHDSKPLGLDRSICYTLEASTRQVQGTEQSNVRACWGLSTRLDLHFIEGFLGKLLFSTQQEWQVACVLQDYDSEAGSIETDISKVGFLLICALLWLLPHLMVCIVSIQK